MQKPIGKNKLILALILAAGANIFQILFVIGWISTKTDNMPLAWASVICIICGLWVNGDLKSKD